MTNTQSKLAAILVAIVLIAAGIFYATTRTSGGEPALGSTVTQNVPWFSNGYKYGTSNALFLSSSMTVAAGSDQAVWRNLTGQTVVIDTTHVVTNATSSTSVSESNYVISVGATTSATIKEPYSITWITNLQTPLLIDKYNLATSTATGFAAGNLLTRIVADNFAFHPTASSSVIQVPSGWYLFAKIDAICTADGACGKTSTSTNRGFTTLSVPFWYHYSSPN